MYCLAIPGQTPSADRLPPQPVEDPVSRDSTPAQLQVVPYDALAAPGGRQSFHLRLYNARGQLLREVPAGEATFAVDGPGAISAAGQYTAPAVAGHDCALITARLGDISGTARVRIVPPLPWSFDFNSDANVPLTWIGGRVRWEVRNEGGERFIAKKTLLPTPRDPNNKLGTRSFIWMGPTNLSNYTIQGDVQLTVDPSGRISDIGLINSRYQLSVRGLNKKLRLDSWTPSDYRTKAEADFAPEPGVWYTLKLSVTPYGDGTTATARGKIWRRDEIEPSNWIVEMVDRMPNLYGTPGVYGNTPEAEVFLDNLIVTPN
jgi:hypothetical protein